MLETLTTYPVTRTKVIALKKALPNFTDSSGQRLQKLLSPMGRIHYLIDTNQLDQAMDELGAVQAWPQAKALLGQAQLLKGAELIHLGELETALDMLEKARSNGADIKPLTDQIVELSIKFSKNNMDQLNAVTDEKNLGTIFGKGVATLERVRKLIGDEPRLCSELAASLVWQFRFTLKAGKKDEADKLIQRAFALSPNDSNIREAYHIYLHNRGVEYANASRYDQAITELLAALKIKDSADTRKTIAQCYTIRGVKKANSYDRYGAKIDLDLALKYDPYNPDIRRLRNQLP